MPVTQSLTPPGLSGPLPGPDETFIREYKNAIPAELCATAVELFNNSDYTYVGRVGGKYLPSDPNTSSRVAKHIKSSIDLDILPEAARFPELWSEITMLMLKAIHDTCLLYAEQVVSLQMIRSEHGIKNSGVQFQGYQANGVDGFALHIDRASRATSERVLAGVIYLNDVAVGGETYFPIQDITVTPEAGKIAWFPAGFTHPHMARTPVSGPKLVATTFMSYAEGRES